MARSLNKILLIGNLTRDPEMRYTPQGTAVCSFGLATNRQWRTDSGELKEETEFFRIVAWNKLAEICSNMLHKGNRVYVEGRLQTRTWTGNDNQVRTTVEVVINDMILLTARQEEEISVPEELGEAPSEPGVASAETPEMKPKKSVTTKHKSSEKNKNEDDLPF
ncbi:single-stranded DNA-binding protein [Candidatus Woesebacteria bacterium]|nr:single-stranded DNA-binding protein [Candidatus Woesebacteria bacterium]